VPNLIFSSLGRIPTAFISEWRSASNRFVTCTLPATPTLLIAN
jgi:hypothetical protein